jgi:hypothetical protein
MHRVVAIASLLSTALPAVAAELPIRPDPRTTLNAVLTTDAATVCVKGR